MAYVWVLGPCFGCGRMFGFNADLVPSITVSRRDNVWIYDPNGQREPVCGTCVTRVNPQRSALGLPPIEVRPGAYEPGYAEGWGDHG